MITEDFHKHRKMSTEACIKQKNAERAEINNEIASFFASGGSIHEVGQTKSRDLSLGVLHSMRVSNRRLDK